jgi:hypothetical protein
LITVSVEPLLNIAEQLLVADQSFDCAGQNPEHDRQQAVRIGADDRQRTRDIVTEKALDLLTLSTIPTA